MYGWGFCLDPYSIGILDRRNYVGAEGERHPSLDPYSIGILDRLSYYN